MRSRFWRCSTQLMVSGKSSSRARRAAAIFFSKDRLPAMRSLSAWSGLWIEICTWSRPAAFSASAAGRVNSVPAVMSDEYSSASRAPAHSSTRSRRSIGSPPVSASWSTPSARASRNARSQCSVSSSSRYVSPPMCSGLEQYGQCSGHWYDSSAIRVDGLGGCIDHQSFLGQGGDELDDVVADVGAVVARGELGGDVVKRALSVAEAEHLGGGGIEPHDALRDQQQVLLADLVVAE